MSKQPSKQAGILIPENCVPPDPGLVGLARAGLAPQIPGAEAYLDQLPELLSWLELIARRNTPTDDAARDCSQETVLRIIAHWHSFDPKRPGGLRAWAASILRNVVIDRHRRESRLRIFNLGAE